MQRSRSLGPPAGTVKQHDGYLQRVTYYRHKMWRKHRDVGGFPGAKSQPRDGQPSD